MEAISAPTAPPASYAQWSCWLDAFDSGACDGELLRLAGCAQPTWSNGVAQLFAERLHQSMNTRLNRIGTTLGERLKAVASESAVSLAMIQARQEFASLVRFAELPCLQEVLRKELAALIADHLDKRQKALEENARQDRTGRLAHAVRHNPLNRPTQAPPDVARLQAKPARRRILI
jgi:hypothetical protein